MLKKTGLFAACALFALAASGCVCHGGHRHHHHHCDSGYSWDYDSSCDDGAWFALAAGFFAGLLASDGCR